MNKGPLLGALIFALVIGLSLVISGDERGAESPAGQPAADDSADGSANDSTELAEPSDQTNTGPVRAVIERTAPADPTERVQADEHTPERPNTVDAHTPAATPEPPTNQRVQTGEPVPEVPMEDALPDVDLMANEEVVAQLYESFPDLVACHRMLIELEPDTPRELTFQFDLIVHADADSDAGRPELQSVSSADLDIEDSACFAEVLEEIRVPRPDGDTAYASGLQVSMRVEEGETE